MKIIGVKYLAAISIAKHQNMRQRRKERTSKKYQAGSKTSDVVAISIDGGDARGIGEDYLRAPLLPLPHTARAAYAPLHTPRTLRTTPAAPRTHARAARTRAALPNSPTTTGYAHAPARTLRALYAPAPTACLRCLHNTCPTLPHAAYLPGVAAKDDEGARQAGGRRRRRRRRGVQRHQALAAPLVNNSAHQHRHHGIDSGQRQISLASSVS